MRGFDPASEDDMPDNCMSRYMENNDEEGFIYLRHKVGEQIRTHTGVRHLCVIYYWMLLRSS